MRGCGSRRFRLIVTEQQAEPDQFSRLVEVASDISKAASTSLPVEEREAHDAAQQSVVDARRSAEMHEGLLQVR